jgi:LacI family transcriptional regulator
MSQPRITLRDVARAVGVHPSTVSRVLNPETRGMVTPEIARRVTEAARQLGYRPNPFAYSLKTNRSLMVGVLVPDLINPIFPPIIRGIESVLDGVGYTAIVANSDMQAERERTILDRMKERQVDGLILATAHREDATITGLLAEKMPLVLINRTLDSPAVDSVINGDQAGIRLAVEHLAGLGHRRIAHLAGPQDFSTGYRRLAGFIEMMRASGLDPAPERIAVCTAYAEEAGRKAMLGLLDRADFSAVVAANDLLALGCYDALQERGLRCPDDLSITGFNDMPLVDKLRPPLTTVHVPLYEMGAEAARMLLDRIHGTGARPRAVELEPTLTLRASTGPASRPE